MKLWDKGWVIVIRPSIVGGEAGEMKAPGLAGGGGSHHTVSLRSQAGPTTGRGLSRKPGERDAHSSLAAASAGLQSGLWRWASGHAWSAGEAGRKTSKIQRR